MFTNQTQNEINQDYTDNLQKQLSEMKPDVLNVRLSSDTTEIVPDETSVPELEEQELEEQEQDEETDEETGDFDKQFETKFGVKTEEAKSLFTDLMAMRDEMTLMRVWELSPVEYGQRMTEVRDFFQKLPEDKQSEFDNVEGAMSIWNYLQSQKPEETKSNKIDKVRGKKTNVASQPTKRIYTRSEIVGMSKDEYNKVRADINQAYFEGRIVDK